MNASQQPQLARLPTCLARLPKMSSLVLGPQIPSAGSENLIAARVDGWAPPR